MARNDDAGFGPYADPGRSGPSGRPSLVLSILPLAFMAAIYPTLLAGVIVILARPAPERLLIGFLLGGWTVSLIFGLIIVFALKGVVSTSDLHSGTPGVDIVFGALSLLLAAYLWRRRKRGSLGRRHWRWHHRSGAVEAAAKRHRSSAASLTERTLARGTAREAFALGAILNLPGLWYLVALNEIAAAHHGPVASILLIVLFNAIMFVLVEVPVIGFMFSPARTRAEATRFREWLSRNARSLATAAAAAIGIYLIVKGLVILN
jgi:hypothetical protein